MRGFGLQQRLAVGVVSVAFLLAAGVPAVQAAPCYDASLDGLKVGRCGQSSSPQRKLQVVKPVKRMTGPDSMFRKAV